MWQLSIKTSPEAEEAVSELLNQLFPESCSSYTDIERGQAIVSAFLKNRGLFTPAKKTRLVAALERVRQSGLHPRKIHFTFRKVPPQNWAQSWKRHFKPIEFGPALLIKPGWSKRAAKPCQATVILDPGLSFGTGQHPTTSFCLEQIIAFEDAHHLHRRKTKDLPTASFLDVGTGSGILAIAAAKLGYSPIHAFDFDLEAVRIARANARRNRVGHKIRFFRQDIAKFSSGRQYSLICANLTANVLSGAAQTLMPCLNPNGRLVLAGILETEFIPLQHQFEKLGLRLMKRKTQAEWSSGSFEFRA